MWKTEYFAGSEIGSGFGEPGSTPLPKITRSTPHPPGVTRIPGILYLDFTNSFCLGAWLSFVLLYIYSKTFSDALPQFSQSSFVSVVDSMEFISVRSNKASGILLKKNIDFKFCYHLDGYDIIPIGLNNRDVLRCLLSLETQGIRPVTTGSG